MLDLLVDAAATYRLTRLVTTDTFPPVKAARVRIVNDHTTTTRNAHGTTDEPDALAELVQCPHCASFWIAVAVVAARILAPKWWRPLATALAFSAVAGNVSAVLDAD